LSVAELPESDVESRSGVDGVATVVVLITKPVSAVEAPTAFVALRTADGMNLRWKAPMATDGLTGFNVELKPAGGEWAVVATTGPTELTHAVIRSSSDSWTQFRVSSVYSDGQTASAKIFGLAGQYE
jgi:hypothetical protein